MRAILLGLILWNSTAVEHYVAPDGRKENAGTKESPWDLASALSRKVEPGATIWVRGGDYRGRFEARLAGSEAAPILVRSVPGERASIVDSGLSVMKGSDYVWFRDLEIRGTTPVEKRVSAFPGQGPRDLPGSGGLNVYGGKGGRFINLVIHDNTFGGVGWWVEAVDGEMHGCIIYNNGWKAPDRTHGHCIYVQNRDGVKTISNCILAVPEWGGSYTMHAYGSSKAFVDNFVIEDNIAYERGPFLIGGGRPSHGIVIRRNYLHKVDLMVGYGAENEDCEVRDNVLVSGRISIRKYRKAVNEGNASGVPQNRAILIPNKYDPARAHLAVYNSAKAAAVRVPAGPFLKAGDAFRLLDAKDFFGKPVVEGKLEGDAIAVPMSGEFAAFVLMKK